MLLFVNPPELYLFDQLWDINYPHIQKKKQNHYLHFGWDIMQIVGMFSL